MEQRYARDLVNSSEVVIDRIDKATRFRMVSAVIPYTFYTFSADGTGNNTFTLDGPIVITITPNNYTETTLAAHIKTQLTGSLHAAAAGFDCKATDGHLVITNATAFDILSSTAVPAGIGTVAGATSYTGGAIMLCAPKYLEIRADIVTNYRSSSRNDQIVCAVMVDKIPQQYIFYKSDPTEYIMLSSRVIQKITFTLWRPDLNCAVNLNGGSFAVDFIVS